MILAKACKHYVSGTNYDIILSLVEWIEMLCGTELHLI